MRSGKTYPSYGSPASSVIGTYAYRTPRSDLQLSSVFIGLWLTIAFASLVWHDCGEFPYHQQCIELAQKVLTHVTLTISHVRRQESWRLAALLDPINQE